MTPALFDALGMQSAAGRLLRNGDDTAGRVVVITHGFWTRRFGADPGVIGRSLSLNGASYEVVGVLPPTFTMPVAASEVVVPLVEAEVRRAEGATTFLRIVGRLKDGVTVRQAEAQLTRIAAELQTLRPATNARKPGIAVDRLHDAIAGNNAATLRMLLAAVLIVLLLVGESCAVARPRVISSAGAGRARSAPIARQSRGSSWRSCAAGDLRRARRCWRVRASCCRQRRRAAAGGRNRHQRRRRAFALVITVATGSDRPHPRAADPAAERLRRSARRGPRHRHCRVPRYAACWSASGGVSRLLLVAVGQYAASAPRRPSIPDSPEHALTMRRALPRTRYVDRADILAFQQRLEQRPQVLPGVRAVGGVNVLPLSGAQASVDFAVVGRRFRATVCQPP